MTALQKELQARAGDLADVTIKKSKYSSDAAFWRGKREFAHFEKGQAIELRLTKPLIQKLKPDYRLEVGYPVRDWVRVYFENEQDLDFTMKLLEQAYQANR